VPTVLVPAVAIAVHWGFAVLGMRSLREDIPSLIGEVNDILGATAAFADPPRA
jgi:hypothetical protein